MNTEIETVVKQAGGLAVNQSASAKEDVGKHTCDEIIGRLVSVLQGLPDEVSIHKYGTSITLNINRAGFMTQAAFKTLESTSLKECLHSLKLLTSHGSDYKVASLGDGYSIFKSHLELEPSLGLEEYVRIVQLLGRSSGALFVTGNTRSRLNAYFHMITEPLKGQFANWFEITSTGGKTVAENDHFSIPVADIHAFCSEYSPTLLLIKDVPHLSKLDILNLANRGVLVVAKLSGHNTLHVYTEMFRDIDHGLLSNHLIGVTSLSCAPIFNPSAMFKKVPFRDYEHYTYYKKVEASPLDDELVPLYGGEHLDSSVVMGSIPVADFIEPPNNVKTIASEKGSALDYYSTFRNKVKGVEFCSDKLMRLIRTHRAPIDLIDRFNSRN